MGLISTSIVVIIGLGLYDYVKTKNPNKMFHQILVENVTKIFNKNT